MIFSAAIEAGAGVLKTPGPTHSPVFIAPGVIVAADVLGAAQLGLLGRPPAHNEMLAFYWANPWGVVHGTDLEYWARMVVVNRYRWADVIQKLRGYGR